MANFNIPPIQNLLQNQPTTPVLFRDIFPPIRYLLEVGSGEPMLTNGNGQYSLVQNDIAGNSAIATGATVLGSAGSGNGNNSLVSGIGSRTGVSSRAFTCTAGSTTLTFTGVDLTSEYFVASGDMSNISIGYTQGDGTLSIANRLVTAIAYSGGDTTITIDSAINSTTVSGYSINPYYGAFAFTQGFNCIAKGVGSWATGYSATANGYMSRADGVQVTAQNRLSRAYGFGAISNDFAEETYGSIPFLTQGDNQSRTLTFWGVCTNGTPIDLTLDGNTPNFAGTEYMTLPDNSISTCTISVTAMQIESSLANYGDCANSIYAFGMKKLGGTITLVGAGMATILEEVDGAGTWGMSLDVSGAYPIVKFTGQNGVRVRCVLEISQIALL